MSEQLTVQDCTFGYGGKVLVRGSFSLSSGEFIILEGKNGSGKSTVIKSILGYIKLLGGDIKWKVDKSLIGYVPQELHLDTRIPASALDIVQTSFMVLGSEQKNRAFEALEKLGIGELANERYGDLSGGQKRRVLLARALAVSPSVLVLDEPTVNIDAETENELASLLHSMAYTDGLGIIVTTHVASWVKEARKIEIEKGILHG